MKVGIIGGGINGLAAAHELSEQGENVILFEKSHLGAGSTGRSGGGIRVQFSSPENVKLSLESKKVWNTFEEKFETDVRRREIGYLFLARNQETAQTLRENVEMQNSLGAETEFLSQNELTELDSKLKTENYVGGSYSPGDLFVDPYLTLQAYGDACKNGDVDLRIGTEVTDVEISEGSVKGVTTENGSTSLDFVVNAAGPWAGKVADMAGIYLPIKPELHRLAFVEPEIQLPEHIPLTIDMDSGAVYRPEDEDLAAVGGHFSEHTQEDPDNYPENIDLEWVEKALEGVSEMSHYFGLDSRFVDDVTGLYAQTPDTNPIIEETKPGFINAVGYSGHGFMHAPATAKIISELIFDGESSTIDISVFRSDRFEDDTEGENAFI